MTNILNEFTDQQLADAVGLRLNGSRWHKIVDPSEVSIDREGLLQLARKLVAAEQENTIPRRNRLYEMTCAERAIWDAVQAVEEVGADPLLTDAVILLQQAREKVADYVDKEKQKRSALIHKKF